MYHTFEGTTEQSRKEKVEYSPIRQNDDVSDRHIVCDSQGDTTTVGNVPGGKKK